jgi:hypothetical protein
MKKFAIIIIAGLALGGCEDTQTPTPTKTTQSQRAAEAANSISFTENAEIDNIKKRLELTSKPGLLGYVTIINRVGQAMLFSPVKGKITSGSKRLTQPDRAWKGDRGEWNGHFIRKAPSDEGTWGSSNPYVYFWTPGGQYFQTSMDYIYSDKPYRLTEKPLIDLSAVKGETK